MDIILLQKVANLGQIGDRVKVKSGYARNFLVPTGRATMATAANIAKFEAQRHELEAKANAELARPRRARPSSRTSSSNSRPRRARKASCSAPSAPRTLPRPPSRRVIRSARSEVRMPTGPIRSTGEHQVQLHLHTDVDVTLTVTIVAEE
jgi:large subunit ribosomal protein L9